MPIKSSDEPNCLFNSTASPVRSLSKANCLAFAKLISLPVINWASNSAAIEDSKSNRPEAILSNFWKSTPNAFVIIKDLVSFSGYLANVNPITPLNCATFPIISWTLKFTPTLLLTASTWPVIVLNIWVCLVPDIKATAANSFVVSNWRPTCSCSWILSWSIWRLYMGWRCRF